MNQQISNEVFQKEDCPWGGVVAATSYERKYAIQLSSASEIDLGNAISRYSLTFALPSTSTPLSNTLLSALQIPTTTTQFLTLLPESAYNEVSNICQKD